MGKAEKKVLVTGVNGFVGAHLCDLFFAKGYRVFGLGRQRESRSNVHHYVSLDILDTEELTRTIAKIQPEWIVNLAAVSSPRQNAASPAPALRANILGALSVCEATLRAGKHCRLLQVGSSKEYGEVQDAGSELVGETHVPAPSDLYGVGKYAAELIGKVFANQSGLDILFSRSFNHTGPGQSPKFVCADWAMQAARIQAGLQEPKIRVGQIDQHIDFLDVRDVASAYELLLLRGRSGQVYNVCSGKTQFLRSVLEKLMAMSGFEVEVISAAKPQAPKASLMILAGDNRRLIEDTGWKPGFSFDTTLRDTFMYWKKQFNASK